VRGEYGLSVMGARRHARDKAAARRRAIRSAVVLGLLGALALLVLALAAVDPTVLCLAPALAFAAPLLLRLYPGARTLAGLADQAPHRRRPPRCSPRVALPLRALTPRGGQLLGTALAVRPPPARAIAAS
jgi:hypothetical protein